jgi:very-short-patch-repair endonuclease
MALTNLFDAGVGSVLSHRAALGHWGLPGFRLVPTHCCVLRSGPPRTGRGAIAHRVRSLPADDVTVLEGIPVVRPGLALLQISAEEHPGRVERALDNAWSMRLVSFDTLQGVLARNARRGRTGVTLLRDLVEARGPDYVPPASGLEARFASILQAAGLPSMRRQVDTGDEQSWIGRVDFAAGDLPLVVEVNSQRFHDAHLDRLLDERRHARLRASGRTVLVFTDHDVWHRPTHVVAEVRRVRAMLRAARRPAS